MASRRSASKHTHRTNRSAKNEGTSLDVHWHLSEDAWFNEPLHLIDFLAVHAPQFYWMRRHKRSHVYANTSVMSRACSVLPYYRIDGPSSQWASWYPNVDLLKNANDIERYARRLLKSSSKMANVNLFSCIHQVTVQWVKHHYIAFCVKMAHALRVAFTNTDNSEVYRQVVQRVSETIIDNDWLASLYDDKSLPFQPYLVWFWVMFHIKKRLHHSSDRKRIFGDVQRWLCASERRSTRKQAPEE